ncbi:hypothetical protein LTR08_005664 [Meristemomyces frigidus]|nr:hypothetical protein LTR08_005664 [Meristemomyces frigidus]
MATQAHCAYAFECLVASFEQRQPLPLAQVEELWEQYHASSEEDVENEGDGELERDETKNAYADKRATALPAAILQHVKDSAVSSDSSLPSITSTSSTSSRKGDVGTPATSQSSLSSLGRGRPRPREKHPLFVTWNTTSRNGDHNLRGCIGTFQPQELEGCLRSYALTSAFEDHRFSPIPASLLPSLSGHVTLLTNFSEPTKDPMDWTLGTHGLRISFSHNGRRYGSTYLPDVAKEQGWTKEETLVSLMRKAGWSGSNSGWARIWRDGKGELIRYEGKQIGLDYPEWREWRDWVQDGGVRHEAQN